MTVCLSVSLSLYTLICLFFTVFLYLHMQKIVYPSIVFKLLSICLSVQISLSIAWHMNLKTKWLWSTTTSLTSFYRRRTPVEAAQSLLVDVLSLCGFNKDVHKLHNYLDERRTKIPSFHLHNDVNTHAINLALYKPPTMMMNKTWRSLRRGSYRGFVRIAVDLRFPFSPNYCHLQMVGYKLDQLVLCMVDRLYAVFVLCRKPTTGIRLKPRQF